MEQRLTIVPQVRHLLSTTLPARRRDASWMLAFIQEAARRRSCAARSHRLLRLQRLQLQDSS
jgi:hypothetical protein